LLPPNYGLKMLKRTLIILLILSAFNKTSSAQNFEYGTPTPAEIEMKSYAKDTSAHAVVLQEFGKSRIDVTGDDNVKLIYEYHVKIKIFNAKAFNQGTVEIPVYNNSDDDSYETVEDIKGVTFYKDDNGLIQKVELEEKKIFPVKENKHWAVYKFAMPGLRNGCVIEYKYRIESPYFENFHSWHFQSEIPKVYSEYEVHIPGFWNYNASIKGALKLTKNTSKLEKACFSSHGASCDCSEITYGMADIPAFVEEVYMTTPKDFMSAINFELLDYTNPYTGVKKLMTTTWKDIDYQLKSNADVGGQLKRKGLLKDRVATITAGKTDDLTKAKAIYAYWQKWFKWNDYYGIYSVDGINKALNSHSGSIADINLSLVAALNVAGVKAETVLLSTRSNGMLSTIYPAVGDFNYIVARVDIGDQYYMLDATDPLLPFGMLPLKCLNDKGRVFSLDKPSFFMDLNLPQKEKITYSLDLTLQDDGKIKGSFVRYSIGYEAYTKREEIKKYNSVDEYVEHFNGKYPHMKIIKSEVNNIDSLDKPIEEKYEIVIDAYRNTENNEKIMFDPFFMDKMTNNPFKPAERSYPVDWGMPSEERYIITMHLPANYTIENPPKELAIALPNNGGKYLAGYEASGNSFTFSDVLVFSKSVYNSLEYPYLKELYNKIIQSEKSEMVFNKNK
jgi:transglutaminase-like putative cysteine protease